MIRGIMFDEAHSSNDSKPKILCAYCDEESRGGWCLIDGVFICQECGDVVKAITRLETRGNQNPGE